MGTEAPSAIALLRDGVQPVVGNPQNLFRFAKALHQTYNLFFCIHGQKASPVESGKTNFSKLPTLSERFSNEGIIKCYE